MKIKILMLSLLVLFICRAQAQNSSRYQAESYADKGFTLPYQILYPRNFDAHKKYPVIFFLHGSGERGNDNAAQLAHGGDIFLKAVNENNLQAIIIFPQCDTGSFWSNTKLGNINGKETFGFQTGGKPTTAMQLLLGLINQYEHKPFADKNRFAVAGLSMGGFGTLELLRRRPGLFKNAISMCGGDNVANVEKYAHRVNLWIIYGEKDNVVPPHYSLDVYNKMKQLGGNARLTAFPEDGHNCWDDAFKEKDFIPFLLHFH